MRQDCELCFGKGTLTDPVLFRSQLCIQCRGTGKDEKPARDWSEFFGMPIEEENHEV